MGVMALIALSGSDRSGRTAGAGLFVLVVSLAGGGTAQGDQGHLIRIDQGIADRDPLSTSLRHLQPDLRQDLGFEHLYVDPGDPGRFIRASGGMYAVSPRTDYVLTRQGVYAVVSPGTVFYIGAPPEHQAKPVPPSGEGRGVSIGVRVALRKPVPAAARRVTAAPVATATEAVPTVEPGRGGESGESTTPTMPVVRDVSGLAYRAARLREIARLVGPD